MLTRVAAGDQNARLAFDVYVHRLRKKLERVSPGGDSLEDVRGLFLDQQGRVWVTTPQELVVFRPRGDAVPASAGPLVGPDGLAHPGACLYPTLEAFDDLAQLLLGRVIDVGE